MKLKILVTAGDGIGPEVTNEAVAVLREVASLGGHTFEFDAKRIGGVAIVQDGTPLPADTLAAALDSDAVLLGAVGGNEFNSLAPDKRPEAGLLQIRAALGGYANLRPAFAFKELTVNSPLRPVQAALHPIDHVAGVGFEEEFEFRTQSSNALLQPGGFIGFETVHLRLNTAKGGADAHVEVPRGLKELFAAGEGLAAVAGHGQTGKEHACALAKQFRGGGRVGCAPPVAEGSTGRAGGRRG